MTMRYISTEKLSGWLTLLSAQGQEVWAPQTIRDTLNTVLFVRFHEGDALALDAFTNLSAKELVMPSTERLLSFRYRSTGEGESLEMDEEQPSQQPAVLFGARACDARALDVLDALFAAPEGKAYNDPGYRARRRNLAVVTLACTTCDSACFCSSFGEGPADRTGSDIFLFPVEGGYLVETLTPRGEELAGGSGIADLFESSDEEPPALAETARVGMEDLGERFNESFSDLDFWERQTATCLSCGFCTYSCPTCYCFNIFDEMRSDREGERLRAWDSCMFHLYTQETSGHNPRPTVAHRYRNRIGHKFSYYPQAQGKILCTGCGRCVRGCPAGVDIRDVLRALASHVRRDAGMSTQEEARS